MPLQMKCHVALLPLLCTLLFPLVAVSGSTYECTMEKRHEERVCVFRNVVYRSSSANVVFKAPASPKVQHVAFEDSMLEHIPKEFLSAFPDLKALNVVQANLSSVVIPAKLERLYASGNRISRVIVHQTKESTSMLELMLDSNQLHDITNLTRLAKLEILNLSGNQELTVDDTVDLGRFKGLDSLRHLLLSDVGMFYVENENNVALPALELLDLSNNDLITSNLHVRVFAPMKELQILRLSHTLITDFDAMQLTKNNGRLKEVYLEGSNFKCDLQKQIVDHLNAAGIATPVVNKSIPCMIGFDKQNDMCCQTDTLGNLSRISTPATSAEEGNIQPIPRGPTTPRLPTTNGRTPTVDPRLSTNVEEGGKGIAASVTLGNSMLSFTLVAIVKQVLF